MSLETGRKASLWYKFFFLKYNIKFSCLIVSAVTFLEYWKRKNASLAHHWDVLDFEEEEVSHFCGQTSLRSNHTCEQEVQYLLSGRKFQSGLNLLTP